MKKKLIIIAGALCLAAIFITLKTGGDKSDSSKTEFTKVKKGDLIITIKENGFLNAVEEETIKNKIRKREINIIDIVDDGTYVEKGAFLIELDSEPLLEEKNELDIKINEKTLDVTDAENSLEITKSEVESDTTAALNLIEIANLELQKFTKLERQNQLDEALAEIDIAEDEYQFSKQTFTSSKELAEKGFETKSRVERDKLDLSAKQKKLKTAQNKYEITKHYDIKKSEIQLTKDAEEAQNKYEREQKQGYRKIQKAEAKLASAKRNLELTHQALADVKTQIEHTKIMSPVSGYALYPKTRYYNDHLKIQKGKAVRKSQTLMRIPNMSKMKVDIDIAEHYISDLKEGLTSYVTIDSIKGKQFNATVGKIALLPKQENSWARSGAQKYDVEIDIADGQLPEDIKPQITASVEIIVDELKDVLYIPVQSVHTVKGKRVVYVKAALSNTYKEQEVKIGKMNSSYIQILDGLTSEDEVLISEPNIRESS